MLERLEINGREYVPVPVAAEFVGYSEVYVLQLARGKWIDASLIQDVYYVDLQSLTRFIALAEQDRNAQASHQARRSKADQILHAAAVDNQYADDAWVVFGKTGVVAVCGVLVGVLAWSAIDNGIGIEGFKEGIEASTGTLSTIFSFSDIYEAIQSWSMQWWGGGTEIVPAQLPETVAPTTGQQLFSDPVVELSRSSTSITVAPILPDGSLGNTTTVDFQ